MNHPTLTAILLTTLVTAPLLADGPPGFEAEPIITGLERPVGMAVAPDGTLFVGEQYTGVIRIWRDGALQSAPFATVSPVYTGHNETGLLGIALSPTYLQDGHVFVFATVGQTTQRVLRYTHVAGEGRDEQVIVDHLPSTGANHNGGGLAFGPDGTLYVSVGDIRRHADVKDPAELNGKILRYNADGTVPADNPVPGSPVWATGFKNTFRIAFQPQTGELFGTEVGGENNGDVDELNRIRADRHHGHPRYQGASQDPDYVDPVAVYDHTHVLVGLAFHDGTGAPSLAGKLLVAQWGKGLIRQLTLAPDGGSVVEESDFVTKAYALVDLVVGPSGEIYYSSFDGTVVRVRPISTAATSDGSATGLVHGVGGQPGQ